MRARGKRIEDLLLPVASHPLVSKAFVSQQAETVIYINILASLP